MRFNFALATASTLAIGVAAISAPAYAQSTGSVEFEKEIVVTGARQGTQAVGGISAPDAAKSKAVLTQENIARQNPGQTILDTINQIPGVSFQNNDAYGSSGGKLNIRGFSSDRVSLTFDGVPLNDSGNYAVYSNQQIDPELIEQVNVNLGTTDVDSPTASAAGGTVNYRSKTPDHDFGAMLSGSFGEFDFMRIFGKIETGDLSSSGLRGYIAFSRATNDNPFNNYGKVDKQQYNVKLYQPLSGSDFISISAHYNRNRNNFFGSLPLRQDLTQSPTSTSPRVVGPNSANRYPITRAERFYNINYPCQMDTPQTGVVDTTASPPANQASCGTEFDRRYNPSDTGNIRLQSKFSLSDSLTLTVDPSFQYVKANGGGTVIGREGRLLKSGIYYTGFIGGQYYFGTDLNGDGDTLDTCSTTSASCSSSNFSGVNLLAPSQTQTHRIGVIAGLKWEINDTNTLRLTYTYDRAKHRQTGELIALRQDGEPLDVFPVNNPLQAGGGFSMQKRDRLSWAILQQVGAEYRGEFLDDALVVTAGVRMPFFKRNLTNYCFTTSAGGFVDCIGYNATTIASYKAANPTYAEPQQRIFNYKKALPNIGFVFKATPNVSLFGNFSQGLSVPGTDNLYQSFFYPITTSQVQPKPETTDNFDLGVRFRSGRVQAQLSGFYNQFHNRLASAYDPDLNQTVYRNLGNVKKYGLDGSIAFQPVEAVTLYVFGSLMKSEIKDNVVIGENSNGSAIYALTAGKRESGAPKYSFGATIRGELGPIELGLTAKRTGERFIYDTNEAVFTGYTVPNGALDSAGTGTPSLIAAQTAATARVFGATAPAYWLANFDMRIKLDSIGLGSSFVQLNVYNLFDQFYVGGFDGGLNQSITMCTASNNGPTSSTTACRNMPVGTASFGSAPNVQIGAPRTVSGTVVFKF